MPEGKSIAQRRAEIPDDVMQFCRDHWKPVFTLEDLARAVMADRGTYPTQKYANDALDRAIRDAAVSVVDGINGYTMEFAQNPAAHREEYDLAEEWITDALKVALGTTRPTQEGVKWDGWENEEKLTVEEAWQILVETPDVTSPEEYPDHALITMDQLGSFMARATLDPSPAAGSEIVEAVKAAIARIEKTMCPTFSSVGGDMGLQGQISQADLDLLQIAALAKHKEGS